MLFQNFDILVHDYFLSFRSDSLTSFFKGITFLGNWQVVVALLVVSLVIIYIYKNKNLGIALIASVSSAELITYFTKIVVHRARPIDSLIAESDFSFPSGHATVAVAFYGFIAFILFSLVESRWKKIIIALFGVLIVLLIGVSRLYLGVHFGSDVVVGYVVGGVGLMLGRGMMKKKTA